MDIIQEQEDIPLEFSNSKNLSNLKNIFKNRSLVRFAIIKNRDKIHCDYAISKNSLYPINNIFDTNYKKSVNNDSFNAVLIVPTGIGAAVGGDSGDGNVAARLIGNTVDNLITHPNVVNGADINEMTDNTLYVEGSVLNRFILGTIGLQKSRNNKTLLIIDKGNPFFENTAINTASAARATLGCYLDVKVLETEVSKYYSFFNSNGIACGKVENIEGIIEIIKKYKDEYDSFCLQTLLSGMEETVVQDYFNGDIKVNPWGGIEAIITHTISNVLSVPIAHAPMLPSVTELIRDFGIIDPEKSPESFSKTELLCVMKGMSRSPRIVSPLPVPGVLTNRNIHAIITPDRCIGLPILAALDQNIPVIAINDNKNIMENDLDLLPWRRGQFFRANNYLEASGILTALKNNIDPLTLKRPMDQTKIIL